MKVLILLLVCVLGCSRGNAQETNLSLLTDAASAAFRQFSMGAVSNHAETASLKYKGFSGNERKFACLHEATMELTFKGRGITGLYSYEDNKLTMTVKGREDANGNITLSQILPDGNVNYVLKGKRDGHVIMGLWSKGEGKKQYAVYVVLEKPK